MEGSSLPGDEDARSATGYTIRKLSRGSPRYSLGDLDLIFRKPVELVYQLIDFLL